MSPRIRIGAVAAHLLLGPYSLFLLGTLVIAGDDGVSSAEAAAAVALTGAAAAVWLAALGLALTRPTRVWLPPLVSLAATWVAILAAWAVKGDV